MSEAGVPIAEVTAKDFIMVRAALVERLGGANEALVWSRIYYRCDEDSRVAHDTDSGRWWAATYEVIGAETGLTAKQARTALDRLIAGGFLVAEQHRLRSNYDQTYSYQTVVLGGQMDLPSGSDEGDPEGDSHLPSGSDVPSSRDIETEEDISSSHVAVATPDADFDPIVLELCEELAAMVRANHHPVGEVGKTWWSACERLMRLDGYSPEQVRIIAKWATSDEFWSANIRSMPTLRKQFSTLRAQRNTALARKPKKGTVETARDALEILRARKELAS